MLLHELRRWSAQGLTEQLLTAVVAHERADLEEARSSLLAGMARDRQTLQKLEDTLLHELSHASGNILDNQVCSMPSVLRLTSR